MHAYMYYIYIYICIAQVTDAKSLTELKEVFVPDGIACMDIAIGMRTFESTRQL